MRQAEKSEGRRCTCTKVRRKKTRSRQMLEQSRNAFFFAILCVWGQSKSRPVKAAGAEPEEKSKIARRCGREAHLDVKMLQLRSRNTF